jgi:alpha-1,4-digalacturonate transport system permease protein
MFLTPNLIIFSIFIILPAFIGVYYSFTNFDGLNDPKFIGLANYIELFIGDTDFIAALWNTVKFVAASVPLTFLVSLSLAYIIVNMARGTSFFRASYYWPVMISTIVVGVMWQWILGDTFGVINAVRVSFGLEKMQTLTSPIFAWWSTVFVTVWSRVGYYMVMFMGGLLSIPGELYEAAKIDGANRRQQFFKITIPAIKPTILLVLILSTMTIFKTYPMVVTLTGGGPYDATRYVVQHIYETAFESYKVGYASAMSIVMLVIVTIASAVNFYINKGGENT